MNASDSDAHLEQGRAADVAPILGAVARQGDRTGQLHRLAREEPQVLGGVVAIRGLVEQPPADADHAVAADHPIAGTRCSALAAASSPAICPGSA